MSHTFGNRPKWLIFLVGFLLVGVVGSVDYLTGDYSLLIFYLIPIFLVSWFAGRWWGGVVAITCGGARILADYAAYTNVHLLYWNSAEETIFLVIVALLIAILRKALDAGPKP